MRRAIPYGIRIGAAGRIEAVPIAHVTFRTRSGDEASLIFVVDSGAATSLLPSIDAEVLGLNVKSGQRIAIGGVTGDIMIGYRHYLELDVEGFRFSEVPVIFAERPDVPRVLGREGIFPRFAIIFDEAKSRIGFLECKSEKRIIGRIFA